MTMRLVLTAALLAASHGVAHADAPVRHPTWVLADQDDKLTQTFADAIRTSLAKAKYMRLANGDDPDDLTLTVLFPLSVDGKKFDYSVDLMKSTGDPTPTRVESFTGRCQVADVDGCALSLVKKADGDARKSGES